MLNRLTSYDKGDLNGTFSGVSGTPAAERDYTLDTLGNWNQYVSKTSGTTDLDHERAHNTANEVTGFTTNTGAGWGTPQYDAAGNMTAIPIAQNDWFGYSPPSTMQAAYDAWNRLLADSNSGTSYRYDGLGRRISQSFNGSLYRDYYYTGHQLIEDRAPVGEQSGAHDQYVWSLRYIDEMVLRDKNTDQDAEMEERLYALDDANFNVTSIMDDSGTVKERYTYDPYGFPSAYDANWNSRAYWQREDWWHFHQGLMMDMYTCLYYNRARYYHPGMGVFVQRDPLGYVDGMGLYEYLQCNPVNRVDPLGLEGATTQPTSQPHDPKTCPTCNSSDPNKDKADAIVVDDEAKNATNCIGWAMNGAGQSFMAHLRMGMKKYEQVLNADDAAAQIRAHLDKMLADEYGGSRLQNENDECPCGTHKIGVYYRNYGVLGQDVHMITQHTDGSWSGKPSYDKPVTVDGPDYYNGKKGDVFNQVTLIGFYCVEGAPRCKQR